MEWLKENKLVYFPCNNKKPRIKEWQKLKKPHVVEVGQQIGVLTGKPNCITVIDIDSKDRGIEVWSLLTEKYDTHGDFETMVRVETQNAGIHIYCEYCPELTTSSKVLSLLDEESCEMVNVGIDIRNDGGYVISPPSSKYEFIQEYSRDDIKPIPQWFKTVIGKQMKIDEEGEIDFITELDRLKYLPVKDTHEQPLIKTKNYKLEPEYFKELLFGLDSKRYNNYDDWIKLCFATGSTARNAGINLLDILHDWSAQSQKYNRDMVEQLYHDANDKVSIGTIWHFLKEDNHEKYNELITKHNHKQGIKYYYEDYIDLINNHKNHKILSMSVVEQYIFDVYKKIMNGGNAVYYTVSRGKNDIPEYVRIKDDKPTQYNNFYFKTTSNTESEPTCLTSVFKKMEHENELDIYSRIDYIPYLVKPENYDKRILNIFKPFPFQYEPEWSIGEDFVKIEPLLNHVKMLCNNDDTIYEYFMSYIAHTFQVPNEKPEVFCAVIGAMGMGKDLFTWDFIPKLLGEWNCLRSPRLNEMLSKFNKDMEGILWHIISEMQDKENTKNVESLKATITDKTMNIEPKGKDKYEINDYRRFVASGNNANCLSLSPEDRRFVIWEVERKVQPREYYDNLYKLIKDTEIQHIFFNYITHYDISKFNPKIIIQTKLKTKLQNNSLHNVIRFVVEQCYISEMKDIHTNDFYNSYRYWATNNGEKNESNSKNFLLKLLELGITVERKGKNHIRMMNINKENVIHILKEQFKVDFKFNNEK